MTSVLCQLVIKRFVFSLYEGKTEDPKFTQSKLYELFKAFIETVSADERKACGKVGKTVLATYIVNAKLAERKKTAKERFLSFPMEKKQKIEAIVERDEEYQDKVDEVKDKVEEIRTTIIDGLGEALDNVPTMMEDMADTCIEEVENKIDGIEGDDYDKKQTAVEIRKVLREVLKNEVSKIKNELHDVIKDAFRELKDLTFEYFDDLEERYGLVWRNKVKQTEKELLKAYISVALPKAHADPLIF